MTTKSQQLALLRLQAKLRRRHPNTFTTPPRPLKIGIGKDLAPPGATMQEAKLLAAALAQWVQQPEYLQACTTPGAVRYDLQGQPAGTVSEAEAAHAAQALAHAD